MSARIMVADVLAVVADHANVPVARLLETTPTRTRVIWFAQLAMYLAMELTGQSLGSVGREIHRHRKTVHYAHQRIARETLDDPGLVQLIERLIDRIETRAEANARG